MATSNIQYSWLEEWIFFIEDTEEYEEQYEILEVVLAEIETKAKVFVFNNYWTEFYFRIRIRACYYSWVNLIIECDEDLENFKYSRAGGKKIETAIRKLEKIMAKYSQQLEVSARFSNWETIYKIIK